MARGRQRGEVRERGGGRGSLFAKFGGGIVERMAPCLKRGRKIKEGLEEVPVPDWGASHSITKGKLEEREGSPPHLRTKN